MNLVYSEEESHQAASTRWDSKIQDKTKQPEQVYSQKIAERPGQSLQSLQSWQSWQSWQSLQSWQSAESSNFVWIVGLCILFVVAILVYYFSLRKVIASQSKQISEQLRQQP